MNWLGGHLYIRTSHGATEGGIGSGRIQTPYPVHVGILYRERADRLWRTASTLLCLAF